MEKKKKINQHFEIRWNWYPFNSGWEIELKWKSYGDWEFFEIWALLMSKFGKNWNNGQNLFEK
jgi:hypothetical protein